MVLDGASDLGSVTATDSLGHRLKQEVITNGCSSVGHCVAVYDEVVAGSPGANVTLSSYSSYRTAMYDLSDAQYPGAYAALGTNGTPSSLAASIASVHIGDVQLCGYLQPTNSTGSVALAFSNGTATNDATGPQPAISHAIATSTASSTCTAGNVNPSNSAGIGYADYTSALASTTGATSTTSTTSTTQVPVLAQTVGVCAGSEVCSLSQAPANGDILAVVVLDGAADLGSTVVKDSLGNSLKMQTLSPNCASVGHCAAIFDEAVTGSPGSTVTLSNYDAYRIAIYDIARASYPGSYSSNGTAAVPSSLTASLGPVAANTMQLCGYIQPTNSQGNVALSISAGTTVSDVSGPQPAIVHATGGASSTSTCTSTNIAPSYAAGLAFAAYGGAPGSTAGSAVAGLPVSAPTSASNTLSYNAATACIANVTYANDVLPAGAGEFGTNGLNRQFWGGVKSRTEAPIASWGPGFYPSWGRHQYDTYFGDSSDGLGIDPFTVTGDTAVSGSPQALRIMAEPMPANLKNSLTVLANDQWPVSIATESFAVPSEGGSLTVSVANPNGAQNGWKVGMGYANANVMFVGTLASGGATPSGNGTGGSNPWTLTNIHVFAGAPGTTITPGVNDEGGLRAYNFPDFYSGALDANINLQYGFFVARLRLPNYLPALSPAFWTLETGGVPTNASGLQRDELDIQEMFGATSGNSLNAGDILWNNTFWPKPTGVYSFPNGTPQSDYHDYGVLLTPGSTTFYLDGVPISGHSGGPDWTQGSPDKEIMLMFQVAAPKTWLDTGSQGASNPWPQYFWAQWLRVYEPKSTRC